MAFDCGASVVTLIPTRGGNGAMEALAAEGAFRAPRLDDIERSVDAGAGARPATRAVFVDVWDLRAVLVGLVDFDARRRCAACDESRARDRRDRLQAMNLEQRLLPSETRATMQFVEHLVHVASMTTRPSIDASSHVDADIAIVGSGFAGSLTALALRRAAGASR